MNKEEDFTPHKVVLTCIQLLQGFPAPHKEKVLFPLEQWIQVPESTIILVYDVRKLIWPLCVKGYDLWEDILQPNDKFLGHQLHSIII